MRKIVVILILTGSYYSINAQAQRPIYTTLKTLNINNIQQSLSNQGQNSARVNGQYHLQTTSWSMIDASYKTIVYEQGIWVLGKIQNKLIGSIGQWHSDYSPGPIINNEPALAVHPEDSLKYGVYKISTKAWSEDYFEWPDDLGAPTGENGLPLLKGDEEIWTLYNAMDTSIYGYFHNEEKQPLPLEIHELTYANKGRIFDLLSNVVFFEWKIINKGNQPIDSCFIGFWTDIDFYFEGNNMPQIDTVNQLGYCWSGSDEYPGTAAVGFQLLYGPQVPSTKDTAIFNGQIKTGYKNLPISSFHAINDDSSIDTLDGNMASLTEGWYFAKGLNKYGDQIIDPTTGGATKLPFSGDPVTGSGWLYSDYSNVSRGGAGFVFFTGPFNFTANDTQWVMIALVPAQGYDKYNSVEILKEKAFTLRNTSYDSLAHPREFREEELPPPPVPTTFKLYQNYPNPFNGTTNIKYDLEKDSYVRLEVFNILGERVFELVNNVQNAGVYNYKIDSNDLSSGVYLYRIISVNTQSAIYHSDIKKFVVLK